LEGIARVRERGSKRAREKFILRFVGCQDGTGQCGKKSRQEQLDCGGPNQLFLNRMCVSFRQVIMTGRRKKGVSKNREAL